uniref:UDG domain-containing protein n=1 Tax=Macrostomum lignano TaxID=282301 RepID=A0A1I8J8V3_9PLAT
PSCLPNLRSPQHHPATGWFIQHARLDCTLFAGVGYSKDADTIDNPGSSSQGKANKHNKTLCRVKLLQQRQYATGANLSPSASAVSSSGSRSSPGGGMASFLSLMSSGQDEASLGLNQDHCSADAATADSKEPSNHIDPNIEEAMEGIEFFDEVLHYQGDTGFGATANQRGANDFAAADQGESATDNHTANQTGACEIPAANQSEDAEFLKASQSESADISAANHSKATESPAANQVKVLDFLADIRSTDIAAANQSEATDIAATNRSEATDIATANQSEATDIAAANQSEATDIAAANQSIATEIAAANQSKAVASSLPNLDEAVDDVLANQSETFDQAPANQIESASSFITSEVAPANQSKEATESLADQREASADQNAAAAAAPDQDFVMAEVKTEVQSADVSAVSVGFDGADGEESEAARQAASWIEDASEAADSSASAVAAAKTEPVALLEAKIEPTETGSAAASAVERKPQVAGVNGGAPGSPSSQPCSSSTSSQVPIPGLSKALESALTRRQRHDLELTGSCPRCEKFREQIVFDENNEPQPGINILPDYLADGLDMVVRERPHRGAAHQCHEDHRICPPILPPIGFTNVCTRPTKGAADLTRKEMKEGIYEAFVGNKNFYMGKQPEPLVGTDIVVFVMPSSSARCAQLPRAADKLPFYVALKKLRDYVVGISSHLNDSDVVFTDYTEMRVTQPDPKSETQGGAGPAQPGCRRGCRAESSS